MIRKLLIAAAAAAMPMGAIAVGAGGGGVAGAATPITATPVTCAMSGSVQFAPPGISLVGLTTTNKTSVTNSTVAFPTCTSGSSVSSSGTLAIITKNSKCLAPFPSGPPGTTQPSNCAKGLKIFDSGSGLGSPATFKSLEKAVKKLPLTLTQGGHTFTIKSKATSAASVTPGGVCGSEAGFAIGTTLKTSPKSTLPTTGHINVCLGTDSNGVDFFTDLTKNGATIASTAIDPATSTIALG